MKDVMNFLLLGIGYFLLCENSKIHQKSFNLRDGKVIVVVLNGDDLKDMVMIDSNEKFEIYLLPYPFYPLFPCKTTTSSHPAP